MEGRRRAQSIFEGSRARPEPSRAYVPEERCQSENRECGAGCDRRAGDDSRRSPASVHRVPGRYRAVAREQRRPRRQTRHPGNSAQLEHRAEACGASRRVRRARETIVKRNRSSTIDALLHSDEPSIRWKALVGVLGEDPRSRKSKELQEEIRKSSRAKALIAGRDQRAVQEKYVYASWRGAHWSLAMLAEIGYPAGDTALLPMRDQVLECWLNDSFYMEFESKSAVPKHRSAEGVPIIQGRYRRCGSQQGNALYSITRLGLADNTSDALAERLMHWQWPDGGWNCDRKPSAHISSFNESLLPMLGLAAHADRTGDDAGRAAASKASEVFLSRRLFRSDTDGKVISPHWLRAKYPRYWHYDMLGALVAMAEMGLINDPRCGEALDLLERKELPGKGWAAEGRFYKVSANMDTSSRFGSISPVDWGGSGNRRANEWVTADALYVLRAAGRV